MSEVSNAWRWEDYAYMYKHYPFDGRRAVAEQLGSSVTNTSAKADKLGLHEPMPFTSEETKFAHAYGRKLGTALMFLMPTRTSYEVEELLRCVRR